MKDDHLSEERARAVWLRAAQLQAEAAQRLEERSRLLAADESSEALSDEAGLSSDMVRTAAIEAGIAPEFVDLALAETDGSLETGKGLVGWKDRAATRLLGTDTRRLDVTRVVDASPGDVLKAMQHVLPQHPYLLSLRETVGEDPLDGAVLVFDVPAMTGLAFTSFAYKMSWADLKELRFVLRPMDEGARTEVLVSVPLERSRRINWIVGNAASGFTGLAGGFIGVVVAKGMALAGAAVAAPIAIGAAGLAVLGSKGIGASYRWGLRTGEEEITTLLKKVEVTCRMGGGFSPPAPPTSGASDILGLHNLLGLMALPAGLLACPAASPNETAMRSEATPNEIDFFIAGWDLPSRCSGTLGEPDTPFGAQHTRDGGWRSMRRPLGRDHLTLGTHIHSDGGQSTRSHTLRRHPPAGDHRGTRDGRTGLHG